MPLPTQLHVLIAIPYNLYNNNLISRPANWKCKPTIQRTNCIAEIHQLLSTQKFNVLVLDDSLQGIHINTITEIHLRYPVVSIIIISEIANASYLRELKKAGIAGIVHKQGKPDHIRMAFAAIADGQEFYQCPFYLEKATATKEEEQQIALTAAEKEVLKYRLLGNNPEEIATITHRTKNCVEAHIKNIIKKTGSTNLVHQLRFGINNNIISHAEFMAHTGS